MGPSQTVSQPINLPDPAAAPQTGQAFDLASVMKAARGISSEVEYAKLLENLMKIVIESAGANKGFLVLCADGEAMIEAMIDERGETRLGAIALDKCEELSLQLVRLVLRTQEWAVLGDAAREPHLAQDPYVTQHAPRSILCIPLLQQTRLIGLLYLENTKTCDAFTPHRLELLGLLASQAAISIENAKLYKRQKESMELLHSALAESKASARVKSELLARISHELRTPLNAIINLPEALIERYSTLTVFHCTACEADFEVEAGETADDRTPCPDCRTQGSLQTVRRGCFEGELEEIFELLTVIKDSGLNLKNVVDDLLSISNLESGRVSLDRTEISLQELLTEVFDSIRPLAEGQGIWLDVPELPDEVTLFADRLKLKRVLLSLFGNAMKFTPRGGRVGLRIEHGQTHVLLAIEDTGIGIAKENQEGIFEPFHQIEGGATRKFGGMGLGLALSKRLIELHEGEIWVESERGKGSTFYVRLPRGSTGPSSG
jgi:signal transduction histidine kinase